MLRPVTSDLILIKPQANECRFVQMVTEPIECLVSFFLSPIVIDEEEEEDGIYGGDIPFR